MDKKQIAIFFAGGVAFVLLAILLFSIAGGSFSIEWVLKEDGSHDMSGILTLVASFTVCIFALAGLITAWQDGMIIEWLQAAGVMVVLAVVGFIFSPLITYYGVLVSIVYAIWWSVVAIKGLINIWDDGWWANVVLAICRVIIAATLISLVFTWGALDIDPKTTFSAEANVPMLCTISGIGAALSAIALFVEGVLRLKFYDYY